MTKERKIVLASVAIFVLLAVLFMARKAGTIINRGTLPYHSSLPTPASGVQNPGAVFNFPGGSYTPLTIPAGTTIGSGCGCCDGNGANNNLLPSSQTAFNYNVVNSGIDAATLAYVLAAASQQMPATDAQVAPLYSMFASSSPGGLPYAQPGGTPYVYSGW